MRKGLGEWQFARTEQERIWLRIMFSQYIRKRAPQVLRDLADTPFNSFVTVGLDSLSDQEANGIWGDLSNYLRIMNDPEFLEDFDLSPPLQSFHKALWDWSYRWHLNSNWWRKMAFDTLRLWTQHPILKEILDWFYPFTVGYARSGPDPEPSFNGLSQWRTAIQTREDYMYEIEQQHQERISKVPVPPLVKEMYLNEIRRSAEAYCDSSEAQIKEQEDSAKRVSEAPYLEHEMEWAVESLILGKSYEQIKSETEWPGDVQAISKAVSRLLDPLDLSRRKGRPRNRKEIKPRNLVRTSNAN